MKNRILAGEVSQSVKIALPRWVEIKKKRLPCSMGVQKMVFATPLARERRFRQTLHH